MSDARSLLLVTVDCLRADHTGFLGYGPPTTPFLDSIASRSFVFRNAMAAGVPTYYSFPAIMASRYPLALGRDVVGVAPDETTLARALQGAGYATGAFLAGNPYLSKRFGYEAGFDAFEDFLAADIAPTHNPDSSRANGSWHSRLNKFLESNCRKWGPLGPIYDELYFRYCEKVSHRTPCSFDSLRRFPAAHVIVDRALEWLSGTGDSPFFLWLHLMDPHAPYYPPPEARELMGQHKMDASRARHLNSFWNRGDLAPGRLQQHRDEMLELYDAGIRWVDEQIARLVHRLSKLGLSQNCVLAVTADHGEEFLDHGGSFHSPSKVNEELSHVPLLVHVPSQDGEAKTVDSPFSLIDLSPTLLDILALPAEAKFRGRSRWPAIQTAQSWEDPALTECVTTCTNPFRLNNRLGARILGVREGCYKLIIDCGSSRELLFNLRGDPRELHPLPSDAEKPVRRRLLDCARRHVVDSLQLRDGDVRLEARLRDLHLEWAQPSVPNGRMHVTQADTAHSLLG